MSEKGLTQDQAVQQAPAPTTQEKPKEPSPEDEVRDFLKAHPDLDGFDEGHSTHWTVGDNPPPTAPQKYGPEHGPENPSPLFGRLPSPVDVPTPFDPLLDEEERFNQLEKDFGQLPQQGSSDGQKARDDKDTSPKGQDSKGNQEKK